MKLSLVGAAVVGAVALASAGCGASSEEKTDSGAPAAGAAIPGGGLTIEEALATTAEGPLVVAGYLIEESDAVRLCSAILESEPPQCGEPSLEVGGEVDREDLGERVSLLGEVEDGVLTVSETAQA